MAPKGQETKGQENVKEGENMVSIDTSKLSPDILALLTGDVDKVRKVVQSALKSQLSTAISDKTFRKTANYFKEKYGKEWEGAYEWNKAIVIREMKKA